MEKLLFSWFSSLGEEIGRRNEDRTASHAQAYATGLLARVAGNATCGQAIDMPIQEQCQRCVSYVGSASRARSRRKAATPLHTCGSLGTTCPPECLRIIGSLKKLAR